MLYPYIERAGIGWMMPILILSILGTAIALERGLFWGAGRIRRRRLRRRLEPILCGNLENRAALECLSGSIDRTHLPHRTFLENLPSAGIEEALRLGVRQIEMVGLESRRFLGILTFIANLSGTLGLLGTVAGVSASFQDLALRDPTGLALSLSRAMYTTIGGIFLFLGSTLFVTLYSHFSDRLEGRLEGELETLGACSREGCDP